MAKRYAVVLSDIHIGDNSPTCWYQKSVHEQSLSAALTWVAAQKDSIREVLFLGDMFDMWTYPPSVRPPTMSKIIAANQDLLGPRGPLAAVVKALPGQVRLMVGNHDITLTSRDIETLNQSLLGSGAARGTGIVFDPATWRALWGAKARTVFSHGHHWCMFNAPDPTSRWGTLPIGHFVTRAIAYNVAKRLSTSNVKTAAHLPGHGNPTDISATGIMSAWNARDDLARFLLTYICQSLGMPPAEPIVMPDGSTSSCVEAMRIYSGLFTRWVKKENRRLQNAVRAAKADKGSGDDLAWFAQRLALQTGSDLVVMGHTHKPASGLEVAPANYVNSGYECVPVPDRKDRFTLTVVDLETAVAKLFTVTGNGVVPTNVPRMASAILSPFQDYSCYVGIVNNGPRPLRLLKKDHDSDSYWVVAPPDRIDANARRIGIWLSDTFGPHGSSGSFTYTDGTRTLDFTFSCPFRVYSNKVSSPVPVFETRVGKSHDWRIRGVDEGGHPLQVRFYIDPTPVPAGAPGTQPGAQLPAPVPSVGQGQGGGPQHELPEYELPEYEFPEIVAARGVLNRAGAPRWRGEVLCLAHLRSGDGSPLLDPTTEPSPTGERLKNPLNHISSRDVQSIALPDGRMLRYVWISPNVSVSYAGGMLFLPDPGSPALTIVTLNVSSLDGDFKTSCDNGHHAEMQLVGFIERQSSAWRRRLGSLALHNRSRRGSGWGYSACNACLAELASFLQRLGGLPRPAPVSASISWERLYTGRASCRHPTDAEHIRNLVASGWAEPMGPRPAGTQWPVAMPARRLTAPVESRW